jgi:hypothetical protein
LHLPKIIFTFAKVKHHNNLKKEVMARPIKDTPILYGKNAIRMLEEIKNVKPLPEERIARIKQACISLNQIQENLTKKPE